MKVNIEEYLFKLDSALGEKSKKDIYMIYIMIFGALFAFSYLLFWDSSEKAFIKVTKDIATVESKIRVDKMYLQHNPQSKIVQLDNEIKKAQADLLVQKDNNAYIKVKIEAISSLIYDEQTWGQYLHSISKNAQKYNIKILDFSNKYAFNNKSFGHILDISISSSGNYKDTLKFMNSLEQSELVADMHTFVISAEDTLNTDINISVWGITY